jgi:hypothetical protein
MMVHSGGRSFFGLSRQARASRIQDSLDPALGIRLHTGIGRRKKIAGD